MDVNEQRLVETFLQLVRVIATHIVKGLWPNTSRQSCKRKVSL
jgi:hypothetical protein